MTVRRALSRAEGRDEPTLAMLDLLVAELEREA
jgi:hypothetical protein